MIALSENLPPGVLCDGGADILSEALVGSGALWWDGARIVTDRAGAVTDWTDRIRGVRARPTAPNTGNGLSGAAGDLAGLQCREGLHCGMVAEDVAPDAATASFAARYLPGWGEEAKTILTFNTGGGTRKSAVENYLYLSEAEGRVTVKDDKGLVEITLPAPEPEATRLVLVSLMRDRLAVAVLGGPEAEERARAQVLSGAGNLFFGCRNQRPGLTKTLGAALIADVWFWPGRALLQAEAAEERAALVALRRFHLWAEAL